MKIMDGPGDMPGALPVWLFQCVWPVWQACLMIAAEPTGADSRRSPPHVRILHLPTPAFGPLADGDLAVANAVSPVPLPGVLRQPRVEKHVADAQRASRAGPRQCGTMGHWRYLG